MVNLYNYAIRVPTPLLDNLCQVHFAVIPAALLRVRTVDFGTVAKVGSTHPYIKVSIIISLYLGAIASGGGTLRRQSGGVAAFATGLKKDAVTKLAQDQETRDSAENLPQGASPALRGGPEGGSHQGAVALPSAFLPPSGQVALAGLAFHGPRHPDGIGQDRGSVCPGPPGVRCFLHRRAATGATRGARVGHHSWR